MKTSTFATAGALLSASYAATVTLETTPCLDTSIAIEQFKIELNSGPVAKDLPRVCGLRILSASAPIDITTITCQAFKDTAGTQPGSAPFTSAQPALIATNPVQEQAISCSYSTPSAGKFRRQDNGTVTSVISAASTVSAPQSIVTSIETVTPSGRPRPSGNLTTASTTARPSASQTGDVPRESTGAASAVGVGMGMIVGAIAAMLV